MIIVIMGIAGSGKTTVGELLAEKLHWPFYDADDFHPKSNIDKMRKGFPLKDDDRWPWLQILKNNMAEWNRAGNAILACSALKEAYREILNEKVNDVKWVLLNGSRQIVEERITKRAGHFMKAGLIDSQLQILEIPEYALILDVNQSPEELTGSIIEKFNL